MRSPDLAQCINRGVVLGLASMFKVRVGRIDKFDPATGLADVKPLLKEIHEIDTGDLVVESLAVIPNVPVLCFGGGAFVDTYPIAQNDECLLLHADRSLDIWKTLGGEQDPIDLRRHNITDAIALVGLRAQAAKLTEWDASRRVIGKQGAPRIAISDTLIHLGVAHGADGAEFVALAQKVLTELQAIKSAFDGHTHMISGIATSGGPTSQTQVSPTPSGAPMSPMPAPNSVAAANVKAT